MQRGGAEEMGGRGSEIDPGLVVLTDERLDYLGEQFQFWNVRRLIGIPFYMFIRRPDYYVDKVATIIFKALGWDQEEAYA